MSENLINRLWHLRHKQWRKQPDLSSLDEHGKRLFFRYCDLAARLCLNGEAAALFDENRQASCTLLHAERYLADRLAYELAPWPKGMMKIEPDDAYALPPVGARAASEEAGRGKGYELRFSDLQQLPL